MRRQRDARLPSSLLRRSSVLGSTRVRRLPDCGARRSGAPDSSAPAAGMLAETGTRASLAGGLVLGVRPAGATQSAPDGLGEVRS